MSSVEHDVALTGCCCGTDVAWCFVTVNGHTMWFFQCAVTPEHGGSRPLTSAA